MNQAELKYMLEEVAKGNMKPDDALQQIRIEPFKDIGIAKIDMHRGIR